MRRLFALAAVLTALPGCAFLQSLLGSAVQQPSLTFERVDLQDIALDSVTLSLVFGLDNPNAVGIDLTQVDYALYVEGKQVVAGAPPNGVNIPANGHSDLVFPANVKFADIAGVVEVFLQKDTAHYKVEGSVGVNTPLGPVTLPLSHEGDFEVPHVPRVEVTDLKISNLSFEGLTLACTLGVTNRNTFPLPVGGVSGSVQVGGVPVGDISTGSLGALAPGTTSPVTIPLTLHFLQTAQAIAQLKAGNANVSFSGQLTSGRTANAIHFARALAVHQ